MIVESKPGVVNILARPLGIEVEIALLNGFDAETQAARLPGKWDHDATITRGGMEWVSKAKGGDAWAKYMHQLFGLLAKVQPQVDHSCGLHVHVQAGDLGWYQIRRLVAIWCGIEESLFGTLVKEERRENHYCIPFASETPSCPWQFSKKDVRRLMRTRSKGFMRDGSSWIKNQLIAKLYALKLDRYEKVGKDAYLKALQQFNHIKANKRTPGQAEGRGCRYGALNLHAFFYQQTVEFRLKEGTVDPRELLFWPLTCGWIVESSQRLTDKEALGIRGVGEWAELARKHGMQQGVYDWVVGKIAARGK
jgi:Putative amidoligase enzyme